MPTRYKRACLLGFAYCDHMSPPGGLYENLSLLSMVCTNMIQRGLEVAAHQLSRLQMTRTFFKTLHRV